MFLGMYFITGVICFLLVESKEFFRQDLDIIDFIGGLCFGIGGYMIAWPYALLCIARGEIDESEED